MASHPNETFLVEAADLLDQVEEILLQLDGCPGDREALNRLFRAFHTIKGSGAMFGYAEVADFTHHIETVLDRVRAGDVALTQPLVAVVLAARDHIQQLLGASGEALARLTLTSNRLTADLAGLVPSAADAAPTAPPGPASAPEDIPPSSLETYEIRFRPNPSLARSGLDPLSLFAELAALGTLRIAADFDRVPRLEDLTPTELHLAWRMELCTARGIDAIKDVFIFADDGAGLEIRALASGPATATGPARTLDTVPESTPDLPARAGVDGAAASSAPATGARSAREGVVRVPSSKLDHIVSLVGEMVMNESRLSQVSARLNVPELTGPVEAIERLIAEMRDAVLGIRMMPIGSTFSRFKRLVHDLSRDLAKDVELITEGAETELDKTVLDQLADPLVHLIRNSIDHGIGTPEERVALGKTARGRVRLAAAHAGSHVVVTVEDNGRGLDPALIRAKAVEKGLIAADASLSQTEIFNLIFLPGFSTARTVTSVSGRGVGMDVVRRQIDALRGQISLSSVPGQGTTVTLALPLTLAIIEGLLVMVGGDPFIIPMSAVAENVELRRDQRKLNNGRNLISVRGELIPYLHLREQFGIEGEEPEIEKIVITRFGADRVGLVVDRVLGSHQTVIQSLGRMFKGIGVVSGGTILGDGRVALILDVGGLVADAEKFSGSEHPRFGVATAAA